MKKSGRLWLGITGLLFCFIIIHISDFSGYGFNEQFFVERAHVINVFNTNTQPDRYIPGVEVGSQQALIEILTGEFKGQQLEIVNYLTRFGSPELSNGMEITVSIMPDIEYLSADVMNVYGPSRNNVLIGSVIFLIISMLIMGRKRGLYAAVSLGFTLVTVLFFMVNFIVQGHNPITFSLITVIITTTFTLLMVSGFSKQSLSAIAGTWVGLVCAGLLTIILGRLGHISGLNLEDANQMLNHAPPDIFLRIPEMFFAGVIVAASGVVVDAAMSISSATFEIKEQSPNISTKALYRSGMNIGGDILGANSNTLILAFAGASLPTVILIVLFGFPYLRIINMDFLAIEIIQAVSATMGMIFTIPATAVFASWLATKEISYGKKR